jgi:hypothetical protein
MGMATGYVPAMRRGAVLLAIFLAGAGLAVVAGASHHATCTATQKSQRLAALAAYRKKMPAERAAYFARHKRAKKRAAFVKRQQTALKALRAAAACTIPPPPTTTGLPTLPIPTDEPGFSWSIPKPEFADNRSGPDSPPVGE